MNEPEQPHGVQFTDVAFKNLRRYPSSDQRRNLARIEQLAESIPNVK
jgi:hypothetical protein